ncbi:MULTISPECIES: OmpH family outer membrane protein [Shewanella]|jgi:outer membrane protein|uniref:Outer membrane chaperone Skp (OmpH) n=1 Tax=Shewanella frigidimarina (strain NCIMB 400) TaxID=318167 RepID=Q085D3_SHEFN|nr:MULTISPECIES: OmpH family outer membrane protein [Shewanella]MBB1382145.1 OmpH family outer membrane protein [Shewanella sp. SR41-2]ABI71132.1 outer membrane chaperone Skp (OmpH) [Shewanella frigidimarina NCIMB 400]MBB1363603.1 OmpH family outer membrane protein [Shewanella sp. SR44-4]MBB1428447.1 OmpH family outer membrane protein [Shewanella sp. SG44-2]MBO1894839.1 OmpH family outer membrane protein [Shewanella sp. BF02_Schw]|tara:strand:- start:2696 stop:3193 length:498 start_codon:yes stop_codon:yes gene_type:complete
MVNRALITLALFATPMLAQAEKLAVVDMGEVFEQLPQREQISKSLKAEFGDRVAEVQKMQEEMRSLVEKQQRDGALMSDSQKTELVRKMESLKSEFQLKGKALDEDMRRRQGEEQNKLLVQVQKAINTIAGKEKYDMVLQRGAVIFVKPEADISSKVVEALSKGK